MLQIFIKKNREFIFRDKARSALSAALIWMAAFCILGRIFASGAPSYAADDGLTLRSNSKRNLISDEGQNKLLAEYLEEARTYYEEGKYSDAITVWNDILVMQPDNAEAKEGIEKAEEKISKVMDFFGKDVFKGLQEMSVLTFESCVDIAKETSLLFQIAEEQINLSKIKLWEARRAFFPTVTLSWSETKGIRSAGKIEGTEYGVESRQPAFHSGELVYTLAQSRTNLQISEENYDRISLDLSQEVADAYYLLVKSKKNLQYMKTLYEKVKPLFEMAQKKYEKQLVADIEYLDVESKFNKIYYKSKSVESDFEIARLGLEQKLNIERTGAIDVLLDIPLKSVDKDMNSCLFLAIENRPDLKMSELIVKSSEYGIKIAEAKGLPKVDLTGYYKKASEVYRKDFDWSTRDEASLDPKRKWYAGLELSWPILGSTTTYSLYKREDPATLSTYYGAAESKGTSLTLGIADNLKQFSESKQAEIEYIRAKDELSETRKKVIKEVREAYYNYEKARIQLEAAKLQKEFSEKESEILKVKHGMGDANLSELFDSLVGLMEANEAYFDAERDLNISIAALNKAIGVEGYF